MQYLRCADLVPLLLEIWLARLHGVHYDPVVVNFSNLVQVAQVVEGHLVVLRDEEVAHLPTDAHVDVAEPPVHVDKHYVVVENEEVHYE